MLKAENITYSERTSQPMPCKRAKGVNSNCLQRICMRLLFVVLYRWRWMLLDVSWVHRMFPEQSKCWMIAPPIGRSERFGVSRYTVEWFFGRDIGRRPGIREDHRARTSTVCYGQGGPTLYLVTCALWSGFVGRTAAVWPSACRCMHDTDVIVTGRRLMFYCHFCSHCKLNGSSDLQR